MQAGLGGPRCPSAWQSARGSWGWQWVGRGGSGSPTCLRLYAVVSVAGRGLRAVTDPDHGAASGQQAAGSGGGGARCAAAGGQGPGARGGAGRPVALPEVSWEVEVSLQVRTPVTGGEHASDCVEDTWLSLCFQTHQAAPLVPGSSCPVTCPEAHGHCLSEPTGWELSWRPGTEPGVLPGPRCLGRASHPLWSAWRPPPAGGSGVSGLLREQPGDGRL